MKYRAVKGKLNITTVKATNGQMSQLNSVKILISVSHLLKKKMKSGFYKQQ